MFNLAKPSALLLAAALTAGFSMTQEAAAAEGSAHVHVSHGGFHGGFHGAFGSANALYVDKKFKVNSYGEFNKVKKIVTPYGITKKVTTFSHGPTVKTVIVKPAVHVHHYSYANKRIWVAPVFEKRVVGYNVCGTPIFADVCVQNGYWKFVRYQTCACGHEYGC